MASASLAWHSAVPYLATRSNEIIGVLLWGTGSILALILTVRAPRRTTLSWRSLLRDAGWGWIGLFSIACLFHVMRIRSFGLWLDEAYWIEQARNVLSGTSIHPASFVGDQPSNFQAWPVATLLALTNDAKLAVRLTGVIYLLAAAAFAGRLAHLLLGRWAGIFAVLFATFSLWSVHQGFLGWNNVTITPVLVLWQLCLFVEARLYACERSLLWLAIGFGLAFSTLYVPLFLTLLLGPLAALDAKRFSRRALLRFILVFLVVAGPTFGKCIQYRERALGRHANFLRGGEIPTTPPSLQGYLRSFREVVLELRPDSLPNPIRVGRFGLWPAYLEVTTLGALGLGFIVTARLAWKKNLAARWTLIGTTWTLAALVATNPGTSCWRQAGLVPLLWVIAGAGGGALVTGLSRLHVPVRTTTIVAGVLALAHAGVFGRLYWRYQRDQFRHPQWTTEYVADRIQSVVVAFSERDYFIALPVPIAAALVRAATHPDLPIFEYRKAEEALEALPPGRPLALAFLADGPNANIQGQAMATAGSARIPLKRLTLRGSEQQALAIFLYTPLPVGDNLASPPQKRTRPSTRKDGTAPPLPPEQAAGSLPRTAQLREPRGIALTADGHVLACDFGNHRMEEFGRDLGFVRQWGRQGAGPGEFTNPCGVGVGRDGTIFVADTWNHRVQAFSPTGALVTSFADQFFGPRGIAVDSLGSVFVADTGHDRIVRFSSNGIKELEWGGTGSQTGQFLGPMGLAIDLRGRVLVADNDNARLQIFSREGDFVTSFAVSGWRRAPYSEPHITVDTYGRIWVTVPLEREVRAYDEKGARLATITPASGPGTVLKVPSGIAFDTATGELVISDLERGLIRLRPPAPGPDGS